MRFFGLALLAHTALGGAFRGRNKLNQPPAATSRFDDAYVLHAIRRKLEATERAIIPVDPDKVNKQSARIYRVIKFSLLTRLTPPKPPANPLSNNLISSAYSMISLRQRRTFLSSMVSATSTWRVRFTFQFRALTLLAA